MNKLPVYEVLASVFVAEDVNTCFALLGDANMNWASAMAAKNCNFVYVRHEHCAVAAAMAYSRTTGKVGVATVTCGPGLTQIMTALPAAVRAHIPLLIFAGEAPVKSNWYNQGIDQKPFVDACGAEYVRLQHQKSMRARIRDAFLLATTKQCPVVIGVPMDLQNEQWQESLEPLPSSHELTPPLASLPPNTESLSKAVACIGRAEKIVVMAGLGAIKANAGPACQALASHLGALLATTLPAKGLFFEDVFSIGVAGGFSSDVARKYLKDADLIIAVGTSLASHNSDSGKLFSANNVLHIDIKPSTVNQGRESARHHLCCDAKLGVEALSQLLPQRKSYGDNYWRSDVIAADIKDTPADSVEFAIEPDLLDPREVVTALDELIPPSWYTVNSSGHCSCFFAQMKKRPANRFLTLREFGAIGNGLSFAMGVATARPEEPVVLFDGDGSLLMHIQELETIVRHHLNILIVVINDGAYGSEVHKLRAEGLPEQGSVFGRPNFASIAKGFGASGATVTNLDDLPALIEQFSQLNNDSAESGSKTRLAVIDVHVSDKVVSSVIRRSHQ
ncbi:thiamine pyrophosphate-binding protein [Granulosicoccus sp.]|nr:thiamine pyrophosphate-binding protein [Granulosicoccus sp.]MDB4222914.1 thiamine pyrophosphate-binding protein [Granulosicoccus sp.]